MKKILLVLSVIIPSLSLLAQSGKTDWEKMNLKGKVKMLFEHQYYLVPSTDSFTKGSPINVTQYVFDSEGFISEEILNDPQLRPVLRTAYIYGPGKTLVGKEIFYGAGKSRIQKRFQYQKEGKLDSEQEYMLGNLIITSSYKYNKEGNLYEKNYLHLEDPDQSHKLSYKYDEKGNLAEKLTNKAGVEFKKENYRYDDQGLLVEKSLTKKKDDPYVTLTYKYEWDDNSNWVKQYQVPSRKDFKEVYVIERKIEYY